MGASSGFESTNHVDTTAVYLGVLPNAGLMSNMFCNTISDITDYTKTTKFKTVRSINGYDFNGSSTGYSYLGMYSNAWRSTSAVTSISIYPQANDFAQYTTFALYGIKGA